MKEFMGGFLCLIEAWTVDGSPVVSAGVQSEAPDAVAGAGMRAKHLRASGVSRGERRSIIIMFGAGSQRWCDIVLSTTALDHLRHL